MKLSHFGVSVALAPESYLSWPHTLCMIWAHPAENVDVREGQAEQVLKRGMFSPPVPESPWLLFSNGPNSFSWHGTVVQESNRGVGHDAVLLPLAPSA